jgi:hypothetical protein
VLLDVYEGVDPSECKVLKGFYMKGESREKFHFRQLRWSVGGRGLFEKRTTFLMEDKPKSLGELDEFMKESQALLVMTKENVRML